MGVERNMIFTERLCNRRNWLEALGLCLLLHLGIGIMLTEMIHWAFPVTHRPAPVISIISITETIAEPPENTTSAAPSNDANSTIASSTSHNIQVSQSDSSKVKQSISAKTSLNVAKHVVKQTHSIADSPMELQQQPEFPFVLSTEKANTEIVSREDSQADSQMEITNQGITSSVRAGDSLSTTDVETTDANGAGIEFNGKHDVTSGDKLVDYKKYLKNAIESVKQYPRIARRRGDEGKVSVFFELDRSGKLLTSRIELSSGNTVLDEAALQAIQDAAPFSRPPTGSQPLTFVITLDFRLVNEI